MLIVFSLVILFVSNCAANDFEGKSCDLPNGNPGECVPMHLCSDGKLITNGLGLIDIRLNNRVQPSGCDHFLDDCCDVGKTLQPAEIHKPKEPSINPAKKHRCGQRNPEGIGYRILEQVNNEAEYGEFPWMAAVIKKLSNDPLADVYAGGASLIHPSIILTAAHIVLEKDPTILKVRVGEWDTTTDNEQFEHVDHEVDDLVVHPHFDKSILTNDVALLFLKKPVYFEQHIGTVCLPPENVQFDHSRCFVSGWGKNRFGKDGLYQTILKKIELPFVKADVCQAKLRDTRLGRWYELDQSFVCAGGDPDKDACVGDGGSPLVCPIDGVADHYYQVGIVAWGIGCGLPNIPGVYVNVAKFRGWIEEQVARKSYDTEPFTNPSSIG